MKRRRKSSFCFQILARTFKLWYTKSVEIVERKVPQLIDDDLYVLHNSSTTIEKERMTRDVSSISR